MLQANLSDASGKTLMTYSNSELGWSLNPLDWGEQALDAVGSGAGSVADLIKDAASNFSQFSSKACDLITNPIVQSSAATANLVPNPYAMATGTALTFGAKMCGMMSGGEAVKLPPGSIATISKDGGFRVAIPIGTSLSGGLGQVTHQDLGPAPASLTATVVSTSSYQKSTGTRPWYKKPLILGGIAAGVVVLGGGTYFLVRR